MRGWGEECRLDADDRRGMLGGGRHESARSVSTPKPSSTCSRGRLLPAEFVYTIAGASRASKCAAGVDRTDESDDCDDGVGDMAGDTTVALVGATRCEPIPNVPGALGGSAIASHLSLFLRTLLTVERSTPKSLPIVSCL